MNFRNKDFKMKTRYFIVIFIIATLASCATQNKKQEEEHDDHGEKATVVLSKMQQEALDLSLGTFVMRNLTTVVKANGQLEIAPANRAEITAIIGGNVKEIRVFDGDAVKKGQVLAVLEHPDYIKVQEDFAVIANSLEYLEQDYLRYKELFNNNVGSGKDYQKAKSDYFTAKAKYQGLKSRLRLLNFSPENVKNGQISNTINIISPISGSVIDVNIKLGTYVDAKDMMFEIVDNSKIHADFMVYEKDVHLLRIGQSIHFTVANRPESEFTATIFAIGEKFNPNTRAVHIHANIIENTEGLIPGMYITGHLHTDKNTVRTLPSDAIVNEGTKSFIFIVDNQHNEDESEEQIHENEEGHEHSEGTTFKKVEIVVGKKDDGYSEVKLLTNLPENASIVLNKAYYLLADMNKENLEHDH